MFFCMFFLILSINLVISQSGPACQPGPDAEWQVIGGQVFQLPRNEILESRPCFPGWNVNEGRDAKGRRSGLTSEEPAWLAAAPPGPTGTGRGGRKKHEHSPSVALVSEVLRGNTQTVNQCLSLHAECSWFRGGSGPRPLPAAHLGCAHVR